MRSYDYFHMNNVTPLTDGNYLVSARHTQTVMKIDATNGDVLWQMGKGRANEFTFIDDPITAFLINTQHTNSRMGIYCCLIMD